MWFTSGHYSFHLSFGKHCNIPHICNLTHPITLHDNNAAQVCACVSSAVSFITLCPALITAEAKTQPMHLNCLRIKLMSATQSLCVCTSARVCVRLSGEAVRFLPLHIKEEDSSHRSRPDPHLQGHCSLNTYSS